MSTAAMAVMPTALRPKYIVRRYIFCHSRSCSSGFSPTRSCRSPQAMLWLNGASTIALTTSGDESASPTPSSPVSVRTRTSTESWLLAVLAWTFGMRKIWQTTSVIFMVFVGWVERSEAHVAKERVARVGLAALDPPYKSRQLPRVDVVGDARHAVPLAHQRRRPRRHQHPGRRGRHRHRVAVRTFEEVDLPHHLAGRHLLAERDEVLVHARLRGEAVILPIESLYPPGRPRPRDHLAGE